MIDSHQELLANAADALQSHICVLDADGVIVAVNQAWIDFAHLNRAKHDANFVGLNYLAICDATQGEDAISAHAIAAGIRSVMRGEIHELNYEYPCHAPDVDRWFSARVTRFLGRDAHLVVSHVNITRIQQALLAKNQQQVKLQRLQRLYAAIIEADQVIDGSSDLPSVYTDICRIAVDLGGLTMAWIGKPEPAQERIVPVASYGSGTDFLNGILISTRADVPEGCGPTGTAYRENRTTFNHNFQTDPSIGPWRGRSIPFNWQSCASFPVRCASQVVALLVVYSTEPNAFDPEEVALLEKLSANLSQAADAMEVAKQQRQLALQLRQSEETYRTLFETVQQGVVFQNLQGEIISANPAAERILGLSLSQMQGRTSLDPRWRTIRPDGSDFPGSEHPAMRALATGQAVNGVTMGIHLPESGTPVWISVNAKPVRNKETGALEYVYAVFDNITETVRLQSELEAQANRDFLTDVANRRHFFALANQELARATRYQSPMSMLMLDIDYFKAVNDTHGHAVGDQVLKMVAQVCKAALREVDVLGRIGGEEFAVLLPQTAGGMALDVAERIRIAVGQAKVEGGANGAFVSVAVSVGVSTRQTDEDTVDSLLQAADTALYKAKNSGRNRVCSAF